MQARDTDEESSQLRLRTSIWLLRIPTAAMIDMVVVRITLSIWTMHHLLCSP